MAALSPKISKGLIQEDDLKDSLENQMQISHKNLNAQRDGTVIPNRIFVGGISNTTTEADLMSLFSNYGTVTAAKIIADRAGVSKGYGFVTFATDDEAKRLQKDADNIILRERRLNIAPAIKKTTNYGFLMSTVDAQSRYDGVPTPAVYNGYGRAPSYDCSPPTPMPLPSQVYRQNGIAFTFHNGMAFFPQANPPPLAPSPMEQGTVYNPGAPFAPPPPQSSPAPAYQYPYTQGQVIYQTPPQYQYHIPQFDGCYDSQILMPDGNVVVPQYYLPPPEMAYFQPASLHPHDSLQAPIMYASPRSYDPAVVYSSEPNTEVEGPAVQVQEADTSAPNPVITSTNSVQSSTEISTTSGGGGMMERRATETPVVSLKAYNSCDREQHVSGGGRREPPPQARRKPPPPRQYDEGKRPPHLNNNNNNPEVTNRNLALYQQQSMRRRAPPGDGGSHNLPNSRYSPSPRPVLPPPYGFPPRHIPHPNPSSSYYNHPSPSPQPQRARSFSGRPRFGGRGVGGGRGHFMNSGNGNGGGGGGPTGSQRGGEMLQGGKWPGKEGDQGGQPLTPPITPKSDSGRSQPPSSHPQQTEELVKSVQAVSI